MVVAFGSLLYLLPFLSVFEEFNAENIDAELQNLKTDEYSGANLNSNSVINDTEQEPGVIKLMTTNNQNNTNTTLNNHNLAQNRSRKLNFLAGDKNSTVNGDASKVQLDTNEINTK